MAGGIDRDPGWCEARLTTETQVNALVKQGNAFPDVGYFALPVPIHRWDEAICRIPAQVGVVIAEGNAL